ncbi:MAG TPA: ArsC family transcriptional regulator [Lachnospiraceae bacterium]|nr:ArsC family transcriptional regulator [Lachnospiraceae bacterium]
MLFIEYPKCSTCQRAKKWLLEQGAEFEERNIVEQNPTAEELTEWVKRSGLPLKRFFNTSGMKYREMELKDKLPQMSEEEQIALLAADGMLVKRPLLIGETFAYPGFREKEWSEFIRSL